MVKKHLIAVIFLIHTHTHTNDQLINRLNQFKNAYFQHIVDFDENHILWSDGTLMPIWDENPDKSEQEKLNNPSLADQILQSPYITGIPDDIESYAPTTDSGRIRYEPFFRKLYGDSVRQVVGNLVRVPWMPNVFGSKYLLSVTTVNGVHELMQSISQDLETLVAEKPELLPFLDQPSGTFHWRYVANSNRLSCHSFGITLDLNARLSHYWQWELQRNKLPVTESSPITYQNLIPWDIVAIFEKYGFIWGGKWYHYDTMHFEYRPELCNINATTESEKFM